MIQKHICNFLLVNSAKLHRILHRFKVTANCWSIQFGLKKL